MAKAMKMYISIKNDNDMFSLLEPIVIQATLPTALKKTPLIKADFTLEDDTEDTSQTDMIDIGTLDIDKRRENARKALEETKSVIEKLMVGEQKETKIKKVFKEKQEQEEESRYFGTAYLSGPLEDGEWLIPKPEAVNYQFYELWKRRK